MISLLENLRLITSQEAKDLEQFGFADSCPLYSAEIDEDSLSAHGFKSRQLSLEGELITRSD